MLFNVETSEDIKKYYQGTWVKFPRLTGDTLWYIDRVTSEFLEIHSDEKEEALLDLKKGYEVDYVIPGKAVYQFGDYATYLARIPARMWKKGMNSANTQFKQLTGSKWLAKPFDIGVIKAFVNKPAYTNPYDAVAMFKTPESTLASAAISPRMAFNPQGSIYIDEVMIGKYDFEKDVVTTREIYKSNLMELFSKSKFKTLSSV